MDENDQREAQEQFELKVGNMLRGSKLCLDNEYWEAGLILLYSLIDAMAWLWRDPSHEDVTGQDFVDWVELYMVPEGAMGVTAMDLYGARCGLLHSMTGESKKHRKELARKVWYSRQVGGGTKWLVELYKPDSVAPITVSVDALLYAVEMAIRRFWSMVTEDEQLAERVLERARTSYLSEGWYGGRPAVRLPGLEFDSGASHEPVPAVPKVNERLAGREHTPRVSAEASTSEAASWGGASGPEEPNQERGRGAFRSGRKDIAERAEELLSDSLGKE